jgi:hypothetical protein
MQADGAMRSALCLAFAVACELLFGRPQAVVDGGPCLAIDDPQILALNLDDLGRVFALWPSLVRAGYLDPASFVERPRARVSLVVEDRPDRRLRPSDLPFMHGLVAQREHAFAAEQLGDPVERLTAKVLGEDAADDRRAIRIDLDLVSGRRSTRLVD